MVASWWMFESWLAPSQSPLFLSLILKPTNQGVETMTTQQKTYQAYYHEDGCDLEIQYTGLTASEAQEWLEKQSEKTGQPIVDSAVNESSEDGCGYYAIDAE